MARRKKKKEEEGDGAAWLVTFTDMMTLLLTFFVLLLSMASLKDTRKVQLAWSSISGSFGVGTKGMDVLRLAEGKTSHDPGPITESEDLKPLKKLLWDNKLKDVDLLTSRFKQIVIMGGGVLFRPGDSELTAAGKNTLDRVIPVLKKADYPLLLTGHTSTKRGEYGKKQGPMRAGKGKSLWRLSLQRVVNVYDYFLNHDIKAKRLRLEAFAGDRPRYPSSTAKGRRKNRRVEIVLDKRHSDWQAQLSAKSRVRRQIDNDEFIYKNFQFDLDENRTGE